MAVGVVVPVLNEEKVIAASLQALQQHNFDEVVVVDGGSTDNTIPIAKTFNVKIVSSARGRGQQINAGLQSLSAPNMLVLHCDTLLPLYAKKLILVTLSKHHAGAFRTSHRAVKWKGKPLALVLKIADVRSRFASLPYGDQAVFFTRSTLESVGGYPTQPLMEDLEFSKSLAKIAPLKILTETVSVSGRRFESALLKQCLMVNTFPTLYKLGVSPETLATWYGKPR